MNKYLLILALPLLFMISSCTNPQNNGLMDNIWNAKSRPELISGNYYYYKEIDGYGDPHAITKHHIIYVKDGEPVEVSDNVELRWGYGYDKTAFKWMVYSDNIVYVEHIHKSPYLLLMLFSPKTGHHTLIPDYTIISELNYDDIGIKFFYYDKKTNKPDYANPQVFTAEELGKM